MSLSLREVGISSGRINVSLVKGTALMTLHYATIKAEFHRVPVTVVMGQPNTHKTLQAKVVASILGAGHLPGAVCRQDGGATRKVIILRLQRPREFRCPEKVDNHGN